MKSVDVCIIFGSVHHDKRASGWALAVAAVLLIAGLVWMRRPKSPEIGLLSVDRSAEPVYWSNQCGLAVRVMEDPWWVGFNIYGATEEPWHGEPFTVIESFQNGPYYRLSGTSHFIIPFDLPTDSRVEVFFAGDLEHPSLVLTRFRRADTNFDGVVNSEDISHFLTLWIDGSERGDFDMNLDVDSEDIGVFLEVWMEEVG